MSVISIPQSNFQALECLHTYKFLTVKQLQRLGVNGHEKSVSRTMKRFFDKRRFRREYVGQKNFPVVRGADTNLPSVYYLKYQGAKLLAEYYRIPVSEINYPLSEPAYRQDYYHRIHTVDVHIALRQWAERVGADVGVVDVYFDHVGNTRTGGKKNPLRKQTRIPLGKDEDGRFFEPDLIYLVTMPDGRRQFATVEIHNTRDVKRFLEQMETHAEAITTGAVGIHYEIEIDNRVRWVFWHEGTMFAAMKRIRASGDFEDLRHLIEFNTIDKVKKDFTDGWRPF